MEISNHNNYIKDRLVAIQENIAASLLCFELDPEYAALLQTALFANKDQPSNADQNSIQWGLLPGLCCQAAGGQANKADIIAAIWILFYAAADIMDTAQDQDEPAAWWVDSSPSVALSAATGLFFCASSLLSRTAFQDETAAIAQLLIKDFHHSFLKMSSGQYADLVHPHPNLDQYWRIADAKSGAFFSLACRSGARVAVQNPDRIEAYGDFGNALGILIQILDDLEDLRQLDHSSGIKNIQQLNWFAPFRICPQRIPRTSAFSINCAIKSCRIGPVRRPRDI